MISYIINGYKYIYNFIIPEKHDLNQEKEPLIIQEKQNEICFFTKPSGYKNVNTSQFYQLNENMHQNNT